MLVGKELNYAVLNQNYRVQGYTHIMQINFFGVINVTNAFLPHMRERKSGTVVIMGSRSAFTPHVPVGVLVPERRNSTHLICR